MRERQNLEKSIKTIREIESELEDNLGLIELGEEEGDQDVISEAEAALAKMQAEMGRRQVAALLFL